MNVYFRVAKIGSINCIVLLSLVCERSQITRTGSMHNAEILSSSPPHGRNDWHVRFTPPAIDGTRRVIFRSTGTKESRRRNVSQHGSSSRSGQMLAEARNRSNCATTRRLSAKHLGKG